MRVRHHFSPTVHETQPDRDDWTECHTILTLDEGDRSRAVLPDTTPVDCTDCLWWMRHRERMRARKK